MEKNLPTGNQYLDRGPAALISGAISGVIIAFVVTIFFFSNSEGFLDFLVWPYIAGGAAAISFILGAALGRIIIRWQKSTQDVWTAIIVTNIVTIPIALLLLNGIYNHYNNQTEKAKRAEQQERVLEDREQIARAKAISTLQECHSINYYYRQFCFDKFVRDENTYLSCISVPGNTSLCVRALSTNLENLSDCIKIVGPEEGIECGSNADYFERSRLIEELAKEKTSQVKEIHGCVADGILWQECISRLVRDRISYEICYQQKEQLEKVDDKSCVLALKSNLQDEEKCLEIAIDAEKMVCSE